MWTLQEMVDVDVWVIVDTFETQEEAETAWKAYRRKTDNPVRVKKGISTECDW